MGEEGKKKKELETADRERSKRKVGEKKTIEKEIMVNTALTTVTPKQLQQNAI